MNGQSYIDNTLLVLANNYQEKEFYALKTRENSEIGFKYDVIAYTLSPSDMLPLC